MCERTLVSESVTYCTEWCQFGGLHSREIIPKPLADVFLSPKQGSQCNNKTFQDTNCPLVSLTCFIMNKLVDCTVRSKFNKSEYVGGVGQGQRSLYSEVLCPEGRDEGACTMRSHAWGGAGGRTGRCPCIVRSNASWVMVTCPSLCTDRQLCKHNVHLRAVQIKWIILNLN